MEIEIEPCEYGERSYKATAADGESVVFNVRPGATWPEIVLAAMRKLDAIRKRDWTY